MTIDRITLENSFDSCEQILDDIDDLMEEVIEGEPTQDQIANVLVGMSELYRIRFRKLRRTYEHLLKTKQVANTATSESTEEAIMLVKQIATELREESSDNVAWQRNKWQEACREWTRRNS